MTTRGFTGRPRSADQSRVPPGQSLTEDFPVLSMGPTPRVDPEQWRLELKVGPRPIMRWSLQELQALPQTRWSRDIHCVTKWSKLDTDWTGVTVDALLAAAGMEAPATHWLLAHGYDGYDTNVPYADVSGDRGLIAWAYDGQPIEPDHGGPVRLVVPHLYFWKSAKWLKALQFTETDTAGFWELRGYHMYGDPWREQRFDGD